MTGFRNSAFRYRVAVVLMPLYLTLGVVAAVIHEWVMVVAAVLLLISQVFVLRTRGNGPGRNQKS